jgi:hypothetical protein
MIVQVRFEQPNTPADCAAPSHLLEDRGGQIGKVGAVQDHLHRPPRRSGRRRHRRSSADHAPRRPPAAASARGRSPAPAQLRCSRALASVPTSAPGPGSVVGVVLMVALWKSRFVSVKDHAADRRCSHRRADQWSRRSATTGARRSYSLRFSESAAASSAWAVSSRSVSQLSSTSELSGCSLRTVKTPAGLPPTSMGIAIPLSALEREQRPTSSASRGAARRPPRRRRPA